MLSKTKLTRMIVPLFSIEDLSVFKRWFVMSVLFCFSSAGLAESFWHCIANNKQGAVWNWYSKTERESRTAVERTCALHNDHKACDIVCFPPRVYWRCVSHDMPPANVSKITPKNAIKPGQGTWYWTSFSKQIAINGAKDACRHNSPYGGCYVDENACASS